MTYKLTQLNRLMRFTLNQVGRSSDEFALATGSLDSLFGLAGELLGVDDTGGFGKGARSEHLEVAGFDDVNYSSVSRGGSLASGLRNKSPEL